jgi:uncharacterized protein
MPALTATQKEKHMAQTLTYQQMGTAARGAAHALFAQTMAYVAATAALFALGAWAGRDLSGGVGIVAFIAAFACLIAMRFAAKRSAQLTVWLLAAFGLLIGLAVGPTVAYYGSMDPRALWEAGGATALFMAGFGAAGYATRRDLTALARVSFWALLALIVVGIVLIFVHIPGAELAYSVLVHHVRLPAAAHQYRHRLSATAGRVDLPRRAERVPVLPGDLLRR